MLDLDLGKGYDVTHQALSWRLLCSERRMRRTSYPAAKGLRGWERARQEQRGGPEW